MKTNAAKAAALLKAEIKKAYPGLNVRVKSENYSGGNSINVYLNDQDKEVVNAIELMAGKYEMGHFDGMNDIYEYSNCNDDIPQVKFAFVNNNLSEEKRQTIWDSVRPHYAALCDLPAKYADACCLWVGDMCADVSTIVWRKYNGALG